MQRKKLARIRWLTFEEGGRKIVPPGPRYVAPAKFHILNTWPKEAWSLVVEMLGSGDPGGSQLAHVWFLVVDAPEWVLVSGAKFEMYEGAKCVLEGEILNDEE